MDKIKELIERVAKIIRYADTSENPVLIPESLKKDYLKAAKQILSDPDLYVIDKEPKCWYCKKPVELRVVHDCGFSITFSRAIPLREAIKEVKG